MHSRYLIAAFLASITTLALFALMDALISTSPPEPDVDRPHHQLGFARVVEETPVWEEPLVQHIDPPEMPPPGRPETIDTNNTIPVSVGVKTPPMPGAYDPTSTTPHLGDGPLATIVRVKPTYPQAAARRDLEGWVVVEFDVTAGGGVENARVVESSHAVFEASALRAVSRFRYRPRIIDGVALPTRGVRNRFRFDMERG